MKTFIYLAEEGNYEDSCSYLVASFQECEKSSKFVDRFELVATADESNFIVVQNNQSDGGYESLQARLLSKADAREFIKLRVLEELEQDEITTRSYSVRSVRELLSREA